MKRRRLSCEGRDVVLGGKDHAAGHANDAFVRTASSGGRERVSTFGSDIDANYGDITVLEFPEVWTTVERDGLTSVGVRIRAESAMEGHSSGVGLESCFRVTALILDARTFAGNIPA